MNETRNVFSNFDVYSQAFFGSDGTDVDYYYLDLYFDNPDLPQAITISFTNQGWGLKLFNLELPQLYQGARSGFTSEELSSKNQDFFINQAHLALKDLKPDQLILSDG